MFKFGFAVVLLVAVFSSIGEYRSNLNVNFNKAGHVNTSIIRFLAEPTAEFDAVGLPDSFLWVYVYGISPLANLESLDRQPNTSDLKKFFLSFVPDFAMRYFSSIPVKDKSYLVNDFFNTYTGFVTGVEVFGVFGIFLTSTIMLLILYFSTIVLPPSSYRDVYIALYSTYFAMMWFSNIFVKDIYSFALFISFVFALTARNVKTRQG